MVDAVEPWISRLDALSPPPLGADFAARVTAAASTTAQLAPLPELPRWRSQVRRARFGLIAGGLAVAALGSVSAAAAGYFGAPVSRAVHRLPVVGRVIERVIPEKPRHKEVVEAKPATVRHAPPKALPTPATLPDIPVPEVSLPPTTRPLDAASIASRISARRDRAGLPPLPPGVLERRARMRANIEADRTAAATGDPAAQRRLERRARIIAEIRAAQAGDPDAQARVARRRAMRAERRAERRARMAAPPETTASETPPPF